MGHIGYLYRFKNLIKKYLNRSKGVYGKWSTDVFQWTQKKTAQENWR